MKIKTLAAIAVLAMIGLSTSAVADFTPVTKTYEVAIGDFQAPISANGVARFKPCNTCELKSIRVTPNTQYVVNGKSLTLDKFRNAISQADRGALIPVAVMEHLESNTVVSIRVTL